MEILQSTLKGPHELAESPLGPMRDLVALPYRPLLPRRCSVDNSPKRHIFSINFASAPAATSQGSSSLRREWQHSYSQPQLHIEANDVHENLQTLTIPSSPPEITYAS
jgi:hypothetical protein